LEATCLATDFGALTAGFQGAPARTIRWTRSRSRPWYRLEIRRRAHRWNRQRRPQSRRRAQATTRGYGRTRVFGISAEEQRADDEGLPAIRRRTSNGPPRRRPPRHVPSNGYGCRSCVPASVDFARAATGRTSQVQTSIVGATELEPERRRRTTARTRRWHIRSRRVLHEWRSGIRHHDSSTFSIDACAAHSRRMRSALPLHFGVFPRASRRAEIPELREFIVGAPGALFHFAQRRTR
jgi:hypothetical protein